MRCENLMPKEMKRLCRNTVFLILTMIAVSTALAQRSGPMNLPGFDNKSYHFGFILAVNSASLYTEYADNYSFNDSLLRIEDQPQGGFNLALIASWDINPNFHVRFIPGLSFQDRSLTYKYLDSELQVETEEHRLEQVYLDFPINLKVRTNRVGNFAAYGLVGAKWSADMQSQKDVDEESGDIVLKAQRNDWSIEAGGGFDFFLPYFKFAIEAKVGIGMPNILIQEDNYISSPLQSLRTRTFVVTFTFEG